MCKIGKDNVILDYKKSIIKCESIQFYLIIVDVKSLISQENVKINCQGYAWKSAVYMVGKKIVTRPRHKGIGKNCK